VKDKIKDERRLESCYQRKGQKEKIEWNDRVDKKNQQMTEELSVDV
jgi:hypothetical protein